MKESNWSCPLHFSTGRKPQNWPGWWQVLCSLETSPWPAPREYSGQGWESRAVRGWYDRNRQCKDGEDLPLRSNFDFSFVISKSSSPWFFLCTSCHSGIQRSVFPKTNSPSRVVLMIVPEFKKQLRNSVFSIMPILGICASELCTFYII